MVSPCSRQSACRNRSRSNRPPQGHCGCPYATGRLLSGSVPAAGGRAANSSVQPAAAEWFSVDPGRDASGDERHHGPGSDGEGTAAAGPLPTALPPLRPHGAARPHSTERTTPPKAGHTQTPLHHLANTRNKLTHKTLDLNPSHDLTERATQGQNAINVIFFLPRWPSSGQTLQWTCQPKSLFTTSTIQQSSA